MPAMVSAPSGRAVAFRALEAIRLLRWRTGWVAPGWVARPRYLVLARDLRPPLPEPPPRPELRWTPLEPMHLARLAAMDTRLPLSEIRRRLEEGQSCHLCWVGDAVAHYRWETTRPAFLPYLGLTVKPLPGDVCGTGLFTHPSFRGAGIHTAITLVALHRLRREGHRRAIAFVAWWNRASLRVERDRAGRAVVGALGYRNLGPWRRYFGEGAVRFDGPRAFRVSGTA
jgi:GNAT superfamily N-acetyltransferase